MMTKTTKKTTKEYITNIIKRNVITKLEQEILKDVFVQHYKQKYGDIKPTKNNIINFYIGTKSHRRSKLNKCFSIKYINEYDEIITDSISKKYFSGTSRPFKEQVSDFFRDVVDNDIKEFGEDHNIKPGQEVDHIYPFSNIVEDFMIPEYRTYELILKDKKYYKKVFKTYHHKNAKLQILSKQENRFKSNKMEYDYKKETFGFSDDDYE